MHRIWNEYGYYYLEYIHADFMYMIEEFHVIGEELNKGANMDSKKIKQVIDQIHYFLDNVS